MWFGEANILQISTLQQDIKDQNTENDRLLLRNHQLEAEVNDLRKGYVAIEERARSELGMVKPGESFYQLISTPKQ
jgi:cell division protein FtsB